ncbi:MAG: hypothetical protein AB1938_18255 [Myxococcota bacterium]
MPTVTAVRTAPVVPSRSTPVAPPAQPRLSVVRPDSFETAAAARKHPAVRLAEVERELVSVRTKLSLRLGELRAHMFTASQAELLMLTKSFPSMASENRELAKATRDHASLTQRRATLLDQVQAHPTDGRLRRQLEAVEAKLDDAEVSLRRAIRSARVPLAQLYPVDLAKAEKVLSPLLPRGEQLETMMASAKKLEDEAAKLRAQLR